MSEQSKTEQLVDRLYSCMGLHRYGKENVTIMDAIELVTEQAAIIDKLPKCWRLNEAGELVRDCPVCPGMKVWVTHEVEVKWLGDKGTPSFRPHDEVTPLDKPLEVTVASIGCLGGKHQRMSVLRLGMSVTELMHPDYCYSTDQAAHQAQQQQEGVGE